MEQEWNQMPSEETVVSEETVNEVPCEEETEAPCEEEAAVVAAEPEAQPKSKVGFIIAAIAVIAVLAAGLFVINNTPMKRLVGTWEMSSAGVTYTFTSEGQFFVNGTYYGTYTASSDTIMVHITEGDPLTFEYDLDGYMLILTNVTEEATDPVVFVNVNA